MRFGLDTITPALWSNETAELAITGPNVGSNIGIQGPFSGTIGSACYAVQNHGVPAIAFSGLSTEDLGLQGGNAAWNVAGTPESALFAELALNLTERVIASGAPYLPDDTYLNVNFAAVNEAEGGCTDASQYQWIFTRVNPSFDIIGDGPDMELCGDTTLPQETVVVHSDACYASVSVGSCSDKTTAEKEIQEAVYAKIGDMFVCLP